jgi:hypothetical protein
MINRNDKLTHLPVNEELLRKISGADEDGFFGSPNTMARRKVKRKIRLYDVQTGEEGEYLTDFNDLKVGNIFCLYEYNGKEILCSGVKTLRVNAIIDTGDGIKYDIQPFVVK